MKVAWFTPFSPDSAIAACSSVIVDELARHCEVDIWVHGDGALLQTGQKIVRFDPVSKVPLALQTYDHCIFNLGNNFSFHAGIYEIIKRHAGVVILHDFIMHHFFAAYYLQHKRDIAAYVAEMERAYGTTGSDVALQSTTGMRTPIWLTDDVARFPLFERIVDLAAGVFVHSDFHRTQVQKKYIGDVGFAYLPYARTSPQRPRDTLLRDFGIPDGRVLAISTGVVNSYKRIERVLAVLGASPRIAKHLSYVVVGDGDDDYQAKLRALINEYGISQSVWFLGQQPAEVLRDFLAAADFAINLRFPNSEGCSLSLIEQMSFGNPVIAIDSGMYSEMPDEAVVKISAADQGQELAAALENLVFNENTRSRMRECAESFANTNFNARGYVSRLLDYVSLNASVSLKHVDASLEDVSIALSPAADAFKENQAGTEVVMQQFRSLVIGRTNRTIEGAEFKTLGIWLGSMPDNPLHLVELQFYCRLAQHLIERHQIECEVWCYFFNESSVINAFEPVFSDSRCAEKIRVIHERNWTSVCSPPLSVYDQRPEISVAKDNLYELANGISRADCFLVGTCCLANAVTLTEPIFIRIDEPTVQATYCDFEREDEGSQTSCRTAREAIQLANRRGAFFICSSDQTRSELIKYVRHIDENRIAVFQRHWVDGADSYFSLMSRQLSHLDASAGCDGNRTSL